LFRSPNAAPASAARFATASPSTANPFFASVSFATSAVASAQEKPRRPNIVIILADDMGFADMVSDIP
jgi:hypothetical protein